MPSPWAPAPASAAPARSRRKGPVVAIAVVVVLALVGAGVYITQRKSGPTYPKAWDARVLPLVNEVQKVQEAKFKHPVTVEYVPDAKFKKLVSVDDSKLSKQDRQDLVHTEDEFRALALAVPGTNLLKAANDLQQSDVLAFYDQDTKKVEIRGTTLDADTKATLVHELTHALQDQRFGLRETSGVPQAQEFAYTALVEGDAELTEQEYQSDQPDSGNTNGQGGSPSDLAGVPPVLIATQDAPYEIGPGFVATIQARDGAQTLKTLFSTPPTTDLEILDPLLYPFTKTKVKAPAVPRGAKKFDSEEFGALSLLLTLADRIPARDALTAALAWRGDRMVAYTQRGTPCIDGQFADRSSTIADALTAWAAQRAPGAAQVTRTPGGVRLHTCASSDGPRATADAQDQVLALDNVNQVVQLSLAQAHTPAGPARCFAQAAVDAVSGPITDLTATVNSSTVVNAIRNARARCSAVP